MAKRTNTKPPDLADIHQVLRPPAEELYQQELTALVAQDDRHRPPQWRMSPQAVRTYLMGGTLPDGTIITPKYIGQPRIIEAAIATLLTDRALLLIGVPSTHRQGPRDSLAGRRKP